ncbi:MAG: T9SS type A sorting domain-containing protein [Candidatus Cloacimonadia bacterium]
MNKVSKLKGLLPLFLFIVAIPLLGINGKLVIPKKGMESIDEKILAKKHPFTSHLAAGKIDEPTVRSDNFDKLLVLLVDFQEDDNPKTTGNGKFILEPDPTYPISMGAPPHDYDFFAAHLSAMRYYYLAASLGQYDLQYDIYPKKGVRPAYTLPQKMSYYNPGLENYNLFIERVEEYFYDIFTVADSFNEIDFSQYAHFMIIHAGSDWQHDVAGDTPHDLPSFFIRAGDGKEVWVNDGTVKISNACNVPATISQDGKYGVINSVMAHEFGHSLGFVDLYNVNNHSPAVGYWDIMDSGGSAQLHVEGLDGSYYLLEGGLPALPSAWHRLLIWQDIFAEMGVYKEISDFSTDTQIKISAASSKYSSINKLPYFIKVPLSSTEYLLLENRNTDPDGDGGIAFKGILPITEGGTDYRVLHYPTGLDDDYSKPTYEYDWLLPGWVNRSGKSYGGGLVVWHIDEDIIFNQGVYDSAGNFVSNYEMNQINTSYSRRGVKIIEADNIRDIGNPNSWFWYGTEYEPYFRYKPILDSEGYFKSWSSVEFNSILSATSKPALKTNKGNSSLYSIYDIGGPSGIMSFKYRLQPYESSSIIAQHQIIRTQFPAGMSTHFDGKTILPVLTGEGLSFYRHLYDSVNKQYYWEDIFGEFPLAYSITARPLAIQRDNIAVEYLVVSENKLIFIEDSMGMPNIRQTVSLDEKVVETPLYTIHNGEELLIIPTEGEVVVYSIGSESIIYTFDAPNSRICSDDSIVYVLNGDGICSAPFVDILNCSSPALNNRGNYTQFNAFTPDYYPIAYQDFDRVEQSGVFFQDESGNIWKYQDEGKLDKIFSYPARIKSKPTQLAMSSLNNSSILAFAAGEHLFAIDIYGSLIDGYPLLFESKQFAEGGEFRVLQMGDETLFVLPISGEGYLVHEHNKGVREDLSMVWDKTKLLDDFYWEEGTEQLYHFFTDRSGNLYENSLGRFAQSPIQWNGYRSGGSSVFQGAHKLSQPIDNKLRAFAYPNPVRDGDARVRVEGGRGEIKISIFDVTGKKLVEQAYTEGISDKFDILLDTHKLVFGVYFGVVKSENRTATFKLAVEK